MTEIIDFFWPNDPEKLLYVTNFIDPSNEEEIIEHRLHHLFSECGLVCEVKVSRKNQLSEHSNTSSCKQYASEPFLYALVKFYSERSAQKALLKTFYYQGSPLQVKNSNKKTCCSPKNLYYKKSIELANYYFGFSGWSSKITKYRKSDDVTRCKVAITCGVSVCVRQGAVESRGEAVGVEEYSSEDYSGIENKIPAFVKAKNQAFRLALENAFSKLLIVLFENGKVHVHCKQDCDASVQETQGSEECSYNGMSLLQINKYQNYANEEDEGGESDSSSDL